MTQKEFFENFDKQTSSTYLPNYSESAALTDLLKCVNTALDERNYRFELDSQNFVDEQFTITVGGRSIAFYLGGPQAEALYRFVEHIAAENLYSVDFENNTVDGWH